MAKPVFHSSVFLLFAGYKYNEFISRAILSRPTTMSWFRSMSRIGPVISPKSNEDESNHYSDRDDAFAELDNPTELSENVSTAIPQLMTERQDGFKIKHRIDPAKTTVIGYPKIKDAMNLNHSDTTSASTFKSTNCILIEEVPCTVDVVQFKGTLSKFGETSLVFLKTLPNEPNHCILKFKNADSYRRAVSKGKILVGNLHLPICPLFSVPIRISNISTVTNETEVHSRCRICGLLEGMTRANRDSIDVFFMAKNELDAQRILDRLNATIIDDYRWIAQLHQTKTDETNESIGGGDVLPDLNSELASCLEDLKTEFIIRKLCAADLGYLHSCIDHLESRPGGHGK